MAFQNVLIVDDDESMRHVLTMILRDHGFEARTVSNGPDALKELAAREYDVVLSDVRMPKMDGLTLLREIRKIAPEMTVVVMSAYGSYDTALEAVKAGAYDYISKPFKPDEVVLILRKAEERERLQRENVRLRGELRSEFATGNMIGESEPIKELGRQLRKIAAVKATVLITGESGTGKELVARAIHDLSPRASMPFVAVNCGAIPEQLIESELFGHARGAFTDAVRSKKGLFAEADGGTIFLDEVGELPHGMQVKLLRVLQEEEVRKVGENRTERIDVRVVAATLRDLGRAASEGSFREDLFYRLNVVNLVVPPLRERPTDVPLLAAHFIAKYNRRMNRSPAVHGTTAEAMELLQGYGWPGNVRELENAIERALVLCDGDFIDAHSLPDRLLSSDRPRAPLSLIGDDLSIKKATRAIEEELIRRALQRTRGNRTHAADLLELSHRALLYKIKEFGIDPDAEGRKSAVAHAR